MTIQLKSIIVICYCGQNDDNHNSRETSTWSLSFKSFDALTLRPKTRQEKRAELKIEFFRESLCCDKFMILNYTIYFSKYEHGRRTIICDCFRFHDCSANLGLRARLAGCLCLNSSVSLASVLPGSNPVRIQPEQDSSLVTGLDLLDHLDE